MGLQKHMTLKRTKFLKQPNIFLRHFSLFTYDVHIKAIRSYDYYILWLIILHVYFYMSRKQGLQTTYSDKLKYNNTLLCLLLYHCIYKKIKSYNRLFSLQHFQTSVVVLQFL